MVYSLRRSSCTLSLVIHSPVRFATSAVVLLDVRGWCPSAGVQAEPLLQQPGPFPNRDDGVMLEKLPM